MEQCAVHSCNSPAQNAQEKENKIKHTFLPLKCPCRFMHAQLEVRPILLNEAYFQVNVHVMDHTFVLTLPSLARNSLHHENGCSLGIGCFKDRSAIVSLSTHILYSCITVQTAISIFATCSSTNTCQTFSD